MAANTSPIFTLVPKILWGSISAANTAKDGTGTVVAVFTAHATDTGSFVQKLRIRALGTNIATVMRVFVNNGGSNAVAANNSLITEITLPATTLTETSSLADVEVPLNFALPATYMINVTLGTAVAAGFAVTCFGGHYAA